jgi:hypothetical protein
MPLTSPLTPFLGNCEERRSESGSINEPADSHRASTIVRRAMSRRIPTSQRVSGWTRRHARSPDHPPPERPARHQASPHRRRGTPARAKRAARGPRRRGGGPLPAAPCSRQSCATPRRLGARPVRCDSGPLLPKRTRAIRGGGSGAGARRHRATAPPQFSDPPGAGPSALRRVTRTPARIHLARRLAPPPGSLPRTATPRTSSISRRAKRDDRWASRWSRHRTTPRKSPRLRRRVPSGAPSPCSPSLRAARLRDRGTSRRRAAARVGRREVPLCAGVASRARQRRRPLSIPGGSDHDTRRNRQSRSPQHGR